MGASCEWLIRANLPQDWWSGGRRVLDFGCGVGRVLRHFAADAEGGDFWGCDIDEASIDWCRSNLSPPFSFFCNGDLPPLPHPDESFDLVYAMSVFTHLLDSWSAWLLELGRLLRPGGYLVTSFMGQGMVERICGETYDESLIGANQVRIAQSWSRGGPSVFHSPWWLRAHWGRAFEIVAISESTTQGEDASQGVICLRKDERRAPTIAELERPEPDEPREFAAQRHNIDQLKREIADYDARLAECDARQASYEESVSWRVTRPLRGLSRRLRSKRRQGSRRDGG